VFVKHSDIVRYFLVIVIFCIVQAQLHVICMTGNFWLGVIRLNRVANGSLYEKGCELLP